MERKQPSAVRTAPTPIKKKKGCLKELLKVKNTSMPRNPVCGMSVNRRTAKHKALHTNSVYYFYLPDCMYRVALVVGGIAYRVVPYVLP